MSGRGIIVGLSARANSESAPTSSTRRPGAAVRRVTRVPSGGSVAIVLSRIRGCLFASQPPRLPRQLGRASPDGSHMEDNMKLRFILTIPALSIFGLALIGACTVSAGPGSCDGDSCASDADCCSSDVCDLSNGTCVPGGAGGGSGSCTGDGDPCGDDSECCSNLCDDTNSCATPVTSCTLDDAACSTDSDCCSNLCDSGTCAESVCVAEGDPCSTDNDCCDADYCDNDACSACVSSGNACNVDADCCSGMCNGGDCG